ncbi:MAG: tetratricopeptide repeat protein [Candidatus Omnitrophica bacterium]|nr:tetratricopeptide repeat protein [Candidatus Omnitrophota bacterium]
MNNIKRISVFLIFVISFTIHANSLYAGEPLSKEDKARFGSAQSLNNLGRYDDSLKILENLYELYPDNKEIAVEFGKALGYGKDFHEAKILLDSLLIKHPDDIQIRFIYAGMLETNQRFSEARAIYAELLKKRPFDEDIQLRMARISGWMGDYDACITYYNSIISKRKSNISLKLELAEIFAATQKYVEAIKLCREILSSDPKNKEVRLYLARFLSWNKRYGESIEAYDSIIKDHPSWPAPRREKARVLGWMRSYKESVEKYKVIFDEIGPDKGSELEMLSKEAFYKRFDKRSITEYNRWLEFEKDDLEALYDLGQVYSRQMQWENARRTYENVLRVMPPHFRAQSSLSKVNLYSRSPMVEAGFEFFDSGSSSRHTDKQYYDMHSCIRLPISKGLYLETREDTFVHRFSNFRPLVRQRFSGSVEFNRKPFFWARAGYGYSVYSENIDNSHNFYEEVNVRPLDPLLFTASHRREDVTDSIDTFRRNLTKDDYKICGLFSPNRRISQGVDYAYSYYSDRNSKNTLGTDTVLMLIYEPTILKAFYRYEYYGFRHKKEYIFSPNNFYSNKAGFEWKHLINTEELFWGINATYYTLRYSINFEGTGNLGHTLYADLHRDWTDRLSTHLEWSKKIYHPKDIYSEDRVTVRTKYYF